MPQTESKILILDIETAPITAYVWRLWDQNVGINQIVDNGRILCVGYKWLGDKECHLVSEWEDGQEDMLLTVHDALSEADAVITYNGDSFDLKRLKGEFLLAGFSCPPSPTSIDVLKSMKKMGFISNKLAFIGPLLRVGSKIKTEGFELWTKVLAGNPLAQKRMAKYCIQDVKLLEKVYEKIKPYVHNHPFLGERGGCGACGGVVLHKRGYRRTKAFKIQRLQCQDCGSWSDGARSRVG